MQYLAAHELEVCVQVFFISLFPRIEVCFEVQCLAVHELMVSVEFSFVSLFPHM